MTLPPPMSAMLFLITGIDIENDRVLTTAALAVGEGRAELPASAAPSTPSFFMDALSIILARTACRIIWGVGVRV
jgi:hypothetical protein